MNRGKYIVLEGPEGVGKTTQIEELAKRLQMAGLPVRTLREPDSQSDLTARTIRRLTQDPNYPMNTNTEVLLYNAARSQSLQVIKKSVEQGVICLVDRNYLTTLAVQYYGRGDVPDYDTITKIIDFAVNGVEPDLTIILDAPANVLLDRLKQRGGGDRFDNLEAAFLERVRAGYLWEANKRNLPIIFADKSKEAIANQVWQQVTKTLSIRKVATKSMNEEISQVEPPLAEMPAKALTPEQSNPSINSDTNSPLLIKEDGHYVITSFGQDFLAKTVTNNDGNVYAFKDFLSTSTIAASMARLSRRGDDLRIILLDEFANNMRQDDKLLQRIITAYGDDSVQQLAGVHLVIEQASNLLTKKLEWGRLASYLEQSTRYIYFDQKDAKGNYKFYTPPNFNNKMRKLYQNTLNQIFDIYSTSVHELTKFIETTSKVPKKDRDIAFKSSVRAQACDAMRSILPVATTSTVGVYASGQAVESLIMHLLSENLAEYRTTGQLILEEARKVIPMFLERADMPERGGANIAYQVNRNQQLNDFVRQNIHSSISSDATDNVRLTDYWPKNELDIVPDLLYEHTNLSMRELRAEVNSWSYEVKADAFKKYMGERLNRRHRPGRAIEKIHYSWDLICDYGIFRDLQRHRMVDDLNWQQLSPRYGYDIPELVESANLTQQYEKAFDLSLDLYSQLQSASYNEEAQYATLLGHKLRWKITYNAREAFHLHELRTSPQGHPGYRKLVKQMHDQLAQVHPMLAEAMIFVNKGEDPELSRLAAEKYTQLKLNKLSQASKSN